MKQLVLPAVLALSAVALSQTAPARYQVSDITMYGLGERHAIFYGSSGTVRVANSPLSLSGSASALTSGIVVPEALRVAGAATLQLPMPRLTALTVFKTDKGLRLITRVAVGVVYYYTGGRWNTLSRSVDSLENVSVTPLPRNSILGAGQLTAAEATALGKYLTDKGQDVVVATVGSAPARASLSPAPSAYRSTALFVQIGMRDASDVDAARAALFAGVQILSSGSQSQYSGTALESRVSSSQEELESVWQTVAGAQMPLPELPFVDFEQNKVVTVFLGQRASGGYGVRFVSAIQRRGEMRVLVEETKPAPGAITTQALTSPYLMLEVASDIKKVTVELVPPKKQ